MEARLREFAGRCIRLPNPGSRRRRCVGSNHAYVHIWTFWAHYSVRRSRSGLALRIGDLISYQVDGKDSTAIAGKVENAWVSIPLRT